MVSDAVIVLGHIALKVFNVILFFGERRGEIVVRSEALFVLLIGVNLFLGLALGLQLGYGLLGHGQCTGLEIFQFLHFLGQPLDLGQFFLLLGDQFGHGLLVGVDLADLAFNDLIKLGPHHMRIGVEPTPCLVYLPGQFVPNRLEPPAYCTKHIMIY